MAEYSREQRNQLSRAIANSDTGSRQLKGFVDNRCNTLINTAIQLQKIENNWGIFDFEIKKLSSKKKIGSNFNLMFIPKPKSKFDLDTKKIGFIQIVKSHYLGKDIPSVYERKLRTNHDTKYRIDSMSNSPVYGSDMLESDKKITDSIPKEMENGKTATEYGYYYKEVGCFGDKIVKKKASMKDEPNIPKIQAQENDFMQFETRAFALDSNTNLGGIEWGYKVGVNKEITLDSAVLLNDNSNYQSAANHWNLLKMTKAPGELSDGRVLTTDGRYKPGRDGYQVQATDYDSIIQAPSLE